MHVIVMCVVYFEKKTLQNIIHFAAIRKLDIATTLCKILSPSQMKRLFIEDLALVVVSH